MLTDKNELLTPEEFQSLKNIERQGGLLARAIPSQHKAKLIQLGLATENTGLLGPLSLTAKGKRRLKAGR